MIGKTIKSVTLKAFEGLDDEPFLELGFTDGTFTMLTATYGGYTGDSYDEYPAFIRVSDEYEEEITKSENSWDGKEIQLKIINREE